MVGIDQECSDEIARIASRWDFGYELCGKESEEQRIIDLKMISIVLYTYVH